VEGSGGFEDASTSESGFRARKPVMFSACCMLEELMTLVVIASALTRVSLLSELVISLVLGAAGGAVMTDILVGTSTTSCRCSELICGLGFGWTIDSSKASGARRNV
jgi:hypothetical protein